MLPVGQVVYFWRLHRGMTQSVLAERSGVSRPNLSAIEQGARDITVQTLRRLAAALAVNPGALVDGQTPESAYGPIDTSRFALDRVARMAAGQIIPASNQERRIASALAFIMKSKTGLRGKKSKGRTARSENETASLLKAQMGPDILKHLIGRVEKNLASPANP